MTVNERTYVCFTRGDAACVEVKEGYKTMAWKDGIPWPTEYVSLAEALTIRTVEDVRQEAYEQGYADGRQCNG